MALIYGFLSDLQRERFVSRRKTWAVGGPLARACGAKLRSGGACPQLALAGEVRCLRHGGPDVARRFRARQMIAFERGDITPAAWAAAEARRAQNQLVERWKKDPRLAGATISLGAEEDAFQAAIAALGVRAEGLYPALADWLRWKWLRHQKDRPDSARWVRTVRDELPERQALADVKVQRVDLWPHSWRIRGGKAVAAALAAGGMALAREVAAREAEALALDTARAAKGADSKAKTLTSAPVKPWEAREGVGAKRRRPDQPKRAPSPRRVAPRPAPVPDSPDEIEALAAVLREVGPQVQAMFGALSGTGEQAAFLRDLRDVTAAPDDAGARRRWLGWASRRAE